MNRREIHCFRHRHFAAALFSVACLVCGVSAAPGQQAAPAVHPFAPPPVLEETVPAGAAAKSLLLTTPNPNETCHPQGSVTRHGSDVYVKLRYVRAKMMINNPDGTDPYGGEDPVELRSFGGCHAGPTIEVLPGNTLHVDLMNDLSKDDPSCLPNPPKGLDLPPGVGCFNTVNLHTHGLHVSPAGNSDNVLLSIAPGTSFPYEINIPGDHPAGTFWYHAHRHGSTATDASSGAAGLLIIRGNRPYTAPTPDNPHPVADIDTVLHDKQGNPLAEKLFVFQQIPYACFSNTPNDPGGPWQNIFTTTGLFNAANSKSTDPNSPAWSPWVCPKPDNSNHASIGVIENFRLQMFSASIWDTNGRFTSINGVVQPILTMKAGEIERWRFLHAGIHDTINVQIVRVTPAAGARANLIANSALIGNRRDQMAAIQAMCVANKSTLVPQFEIAVDGLTRSHIEEIGDGGDNTSNFMQPGYRSDVLVVFPQDGDYCLLDQAAPLSQRASPAGGGGQGPSVPQLLAYIHVSGGQPVSVNLREFIQESLARANSDLPRPVRQQLRVGDLSPWTPFTGLPAPTPGHVQTADFTISKSGFTINGLTYKPDIVNIKRQVNTSDDWILSAEGEPHIFHIHVNPFEIIDVTHPDKDGNQVSIFNREGHCTKDVSQDPAGLQNQYCSMYHVFRDTLFLEAGYQVHMRTYYDRYIGEFVLHCHILDHEDAGMMLNIEIVPDLNAPGGGLGMSGMDHPGQP